MICSTASSLPIYFDKKISISSTKILKISSSSPCCLPLNCWVLHKSLVPLAASVTILLSPIPVKAGLLSGFSGIESVPGPQLPEIECLNRFNENQQKYDERFRSSPLLKQLLERSKHNKEKNKQEIQDKYCIRGAEWRVGDCSVEVMSPEDKENFIATLKQKAGIK